MPAMEQEFAEIPGAIFHDVAIPMLRVITSFWTRTVIGLKTGVNRIKSSGWILLNT